ncbi:MAG: hypothetical protein HUJ31_13120 [Pseudomonadales bacterium]|nr:hypothetical protein [Pseudomonadales bacterium]
MLNLLRTSALLLLAWAPLAGADARRDDVMSMLRGYEWEPALVRGALNDETWPLLMDIAKDESLPRYIRSRASAALTQYPTEEVWQSYAERLDTETGAARRRVVDAICEGFVERREERVEVVMKPLLGATDAHLRSRAAICLERIDTESARRALQQYRQRVSSSWEAQLIGGNGQ